MSAMQRRKGADFEREVVNAAKALGLDARRTAPNQTQDGSTSFPDVMIAGLRVECKHHKDIPHWQEILSAALLVDRITPSGDIAKWLAGHDALVLKQTGQPVPLVVRADGSVLTLRMWLSSLESA